MFVLSSDNHYCPLNRKEYIFDITTELENQQKDYYLLFQRTSWIFPLHLEQRNPMCVDVLYHQCVPDYLEGFMVSVPNNMLPQIMKVGFMVVNIWGRVLATRAKIRRNDENIFQDGSNKLKSYENGGQNLNPIKIGVKKIE